MKKSMDTIQFESRAEVNDVRIMIHKYKEQNPNDNDNQTINRLYDLLDVMDMEW